MMIRSGAILARVAVALLTAGCSGKGMVDPADTTGGLEENAALAPYLLQPEICKDESGPDCARLPLGDTRLTTTTPARGSLYSCAAANPNAPGSVRSRITWIDDAAGTWNLLEKPWLPAGIFDPGPGSFAMTEAAGSRFIQVNNLPVDQRIGDWPMTAYAALTAIDPNRGTPAARNHTFDLPLAPAKSATPGCVSLGAIGVMLNGVVIFNAADARGNDAVAHEIVDAYGGHPAMTDYHYHFAPERLDEDRGPDGHSAIIGYIRDGFPLYGYRGVGGIEMTNADLDECHGHEHGSLGYHYHATIEYPYTIGCYRGTPR